MRLLRIVAVWVPALVACSQDAPAEWTANVLTDSKGAESVRLSGDWSGAPTASAPQRLHEAFTPEFPFNAVQGAVLMPDSSLFVLDIGAAKVLAFDQMGRLSDSFGRQGDGPGEFRRPVWIGARSDSIWVYDEALGRLTTFSVRGRVLETANVSPDDRVSSLLPMLPPLEGTLLASLARTRTFRAEGSARDTVAVLRMGPAGVRDTLATHLGQEKAFASIQAGELLVPIGFAARFVQSGSDDAFVYGRTDSLALGVFGPDGSLRWRIEGDLGRRGVEPSAAEAWRRWVMAQPNLGFPGVEEAFAEGPIKERLPAFSEVALAANETVWIGEYVLPGASSRIWLIVARSGRVSRVSLPTTFDGMPYARPELLAVGYGLLVLRRVDSLGVESVEVWACGC